MTHSAPRTVINFIVDRNVNISKSRVALTCVFLSLYSRQIHKHLRACPFPLKNHHILFFSSGSAWLCSSYVFLGADELRTSSMMTFMYCIRSRIASSCLLNMWRLIYFFHVFADVDFCILTFIFTNDFSERYSMDRFWEFFILTKIDHYDEWVFLLFFFFLYRLIELFH